MSTKIEWTRRVNPDGTISNGDTWNPLIGCDKVSAGCKNCYAIKTAWIRQHNSKMAEKYADTVEKTASGALNWTGKVNMHEPSLLKPLKQKKPTTYFVNSMSDLFHEDVPFEFVDKVMAVISKCPHHIFQVLTKRPKRMLEYYQSEFYRGAIWENLWLGVSCEDQKTANERIPLLLKVPAAVRFLSCEPLLGPIQLWEWDEFDGRLNGVGIKHDYKMSPSTADGPSEALGESYPGIDWVICGGESGPDARPMNPDWARSLRDQCNDNEIPFFFKQWGDWMPRDFNKCHSGNKKFGEFSNGRFNEGQGRNPEYYGIHIQNMLKIGKKASGRLLDGIEHNEMPSL